MRAHEWAAMPDPLPELALNAAAAATGGQWAEAARSLALGVELAERAVHPAAEEWRAARDAVAQIRAGDRTALEAARWALVDLCGGQLALPLPLGKP